MSVTLGESITFEQRESRVQDEESVAFRTEPPTMLRSDKENHQLPASTFSATDDASMHFTVEDSRVAGHRGSGDGSNVPESIRFQVESQVQPGRAPPPAAPPSGGRPAQVPAIQMERMGEFPLNFPPPPKKISRRAEMSARTPRSARITPLTPRSRSQNTSRHAPAETSARGGGGGALAASMQSQSQNPDDQTVATVAARPVAQETRPPLAPFDSRPAPPIPAIDTKFARGGSQASEFSSFGDADEASAAEAAAAAPPLPGAPTGDMIVSQHKGTLPGNQWDAILLHSRDVVDRTLLHETAEATGLDAQFMRVSSLAQGPDGLNVTIDIVHDTAITAETLQKAIESCNYENTMMLHDMRTARGTRQVYGLAAALESVNQAKPQDSDADEDEEAAAPPAAPAAATPVPPTQSESHMSMSLSGAQSSDNDKAPARPAAAPAAPASANLNAPVDEDHPPASFSFTRRVGDGMLLIDYVELPSKKEESLELFFDGSPLKMKPKFLKTYVSGHLGVPSNQLSVHFNDEEVNDEAMGAILGWTNGSVIEIFRHVPQGAQFEDEDEDGIAPNHSFHYSPPASKMKQRKGGKSHPAATKKKSAPARKPLYVPPPVSRPEPEPAPFFVEKKKKKPAAKRAHQNRQKSASPDPDKVPPLNLNVAGGGATPKEVGVSPKKTPKAKSTSATRGATPRSPQTPHYLVGTAASARHQTPRMRPVPAELTTPRLYTPRMLRPGPTSPRRGSQQQQQPSPAGPAAAGTARRSVGRIEVFSSAAPPMAQSARRPPRKAPHKKEEDLSMPPQHVVRSVVPSTPRTARPVRAVPPPPAAHADPADRSVSTSVPRSHGAAPGETQAVSHRSHSPSSTPLQQAHPLAPPPPDAEGEEPHYNGAPAVSTGDDESIQYRMEEDSAPSHQDHGEESGEWGGGEQAVATVAAKAGRYAAEGSEDEEEENMAGADEPVPAAAPNPFV